MTGTRTFGTTKLSAGRRIEEVENVTTAYISRDPGTPEGRI